MIRTKDTIDVLAFFYLQIIIYRIKKLYDNGSGHIIVTISENTYEGKSIIGDLDRIIRLRQNDTTYEVKGNSSLYVSKNNKIKPLIFHHSYKRCFNRPSCKIYQKIKMRRDEYASINTL